MTRKCYQHKTALHLFKYISLYFFVKGMVTYSLEEKETQILKYRLRTRNSNAEYMRL